MLINNLLFWLSFTRSPFLLHLQSRLVFSLCLCTFPFNVSFLSCKHLNNMKNHIIFLGCKHLVPFPSSTPLAPCMCYVKLLHGMSIQTSTYIGDHTRDQGPYPIFCLILADLRGFSYLRGFSLMKCQILNPMFHV